MRQILALTIAKPRSSAGFRPTPYSVSENRSCRSASAELSSTSTAALTRNACFTFFVCIALLTQAFSQAVIPTSRGDNARTGANTNETLLTPANVNKNSFGRLFSVPIESGKPHILAQPLFVSNVNIPGQGTHNVVYVVTMSDNVYAIDADTGAILWSASMLYGGTVATGTLLPCQYGGFNQEGIIGTPAIDTTTNTMYLVAKTVRSGVVRHDIHALDITTGLDIHTPVQISAQTTSNSNNKFNKPIVTNFTSLHQKNRPGLALVNGVLYIGFGGNGCNDANTGWVLSYDESSLSQVGVFNTSPAYGLTSIWQSGNGLAADENGNLFVETAEAANTQAVPSTGYDIPNGGQTYCNSVVKLAPTNVAVTDYFTPYNVFNLNVDDLDMSSTGAMILPDLPNSPYPHELVASGKQGYVYVLNRDSLGMYSTAADQIIQEFPLEKANSASGIMFGSPAYWNNMVYFSPTSTQVRGIPVLPNGTLDNLHQATTKQSYNGSHSPTVSANGNDPTSGILWVITGQLFAFNATPCGQNSPIPGCTPGILNLLYSSTQATGGRDTLPAIDHFVTSTVANGKVFVATQNSLEAYGLFASISVASGSGQSGTVGTALAAPIQVNVANPYTGQADQGATVTFGDGGKGGVFTPCPPSSSFATDSTGNVCVTYKLPTKAGTYTLTATLMINGAAAGSTSTTATATAGAGTKLAAYGGGGQKDSTGATIGVTPGTKPIAAQLVDANKNPVNGTTVYFTSTKGTPIPSSTVTATGSNGVLGMAYTNLQLPSTTGSVTVTACLSSPCVTGSIKVTFAETSVAPVATAIAVSSGNNQSGTNGTQLSQALSALVTDQYGNPLPGNSVTFTDNGAGGTFSNTNPVVTGANGIATQMYTLPSSGSTITINATAKGVSSSAVFTENFTAQTPTKISITSGNNQSAAAGTQLPQTLTVLVSDQYGNPVAGNSVTFTDNGAGGTFSNTNPVVTGANGTASQTYTLPATGANVTIDATATGISGPAVFTETSIALVPTTIAITGGNNQTAAAGTQLPQMLTVLVSDQYGNPVSGNPVTFSDNGAGGSFPNGNAATTGANGTATVSYALPTTVTTVSVSATATGISGAAVFTEISVAGPAANLLVTGGNSQTGTAGTQLSQPLVVTVTDQYLNPVAGVSVTFSDSNSGGAFSNPNPSPSASDGTVSQFYTLPPEGNATFLITATAAGVTTPASFTENSN
jgi:hypothetical protein